MAFIRAETRRRLAEQDRRWQVKLGLRAITALLAFPAFLLFAITTGLSAYDYGGTDWTDAMPLTPVLLTLIYNPIHILFSVHPTLCRPIHPAWPLTIDTLIWATAVPSVIFSVGDGWFLYWQPLGLEIDGFIPCFNRYNFYSKECNPMIYTLGRMEIAANVFLVLILILQFTLFIFSCIAAHKHRLAAKAAARRNIELQASPRGSQFPPSRNQFNAQDTFAESQHPPAYAPSTQKSVPHLSSSPPPKAHLIDPSNRVNSGSGGGFMGDEDGFGNFHGDRSSGESSIGAARKEARTQQPSSPTQLQNDGERRRDEEMGVAGAEGANPESPFHDRHAVKYA